MAKRCVDNSSAWYIVHFSSGSRGGPEARASPAPVKTSQKKDGRSRGPQVSQVIGPPLGQISGSATVSFQISKKNSVVTISNEQL